MERLSGTWTPIPVTWDRDPTTPKHRRRSRVRRVVVGVLIAVASLTVWAVADAIRAGAVEAPAVGPAVERSQLVDDRADRARWIDRSNHRPARRPSYAGQPRAATAHGNRPPAPGRSPRFQHTTG